MTPRLIREYGHPFYASEADGDLCRTCGRDIREHIGGATEPLTAAPATEAGRRLLAKLEWIGSHSQDTSFPTATEDILDIEREVAALPEGRTGIDRDRLQTAIYQAGIVEVFGRLPEVTAAIATEYDQLLLRAALPEGRETVLDHD